MIRRSMRFLHLLLETYLSVIFLMSNCSRSKFLLEVNFPKLLMFIAVFHCLIIVKKFTLSRLHFIYGLFILSSSQLPYPQVQSPLYSPNQFIGFAESWKPFSIFCIKSKYKLNKKIETLRKRIVGINLSKHSKCYSNCFASIFFNNLLLRVLHNLSTHC